MTLLLGRFHRLVLCFLFGFTLFVSIAAGAAETSDETIPPVLSDLPKKEKPVVLPPGQPPSYITEVPSTGNFPRGAQTRRTYVGVQLGLVGPQTDSLGGRFGLGFQLGHWLRTEWMVGTYFNTSTGSHWNTGTNDGSSRLTAVGTELLFPFSDPRFYAGLRLGMGFLRTEVPVLPDVINSERDYFTIGPVVTMEHRLSANFSLGMTMDYMGYLGTGSFGVLDVMGFARFWFDPWPSTGMHVSDGAGRY